VNKLIKKNPLSVKRTNYVEYNKTKDKITAFRARVFDLCAQIPEGYVSTYKIIADKLNCKSSQAVGQALKSNPFSFYATLNDDQIYVPCHRVISSSMNIGGFNGAIAGEQIENKKKFLRKEGIYFTEDNTLDLSCSKIYTFSDI